MRKRFVYVQSDANSRQTHVGNGDVIQKWR